MVSDVVAGATMANGSIEQRSGIIGSDAYRKVADEIGDVVISVFSAVGRYSHFLSGVPYAEGFRVPYTPSSTVDTYDTIV
eukprot:scaffold56389_cov75-Cyclotella_meneghiniana.AAC.15